jgi:hypothetical protein
MRQRITVIARPALQPHNDHGFAFLAIRRVIFVLITALALLPFAQARAQTPAAIQITNAEVQNRAPEEILFRISASSTGTIEKVGLRYKILPDGASTLAQPQFTPGSQVQATFRLQGNTNNIYIHPGAPVEYFWELETADGQKLTTETARVEYIDTRFQWQNASEGNLTVYWYAGNELSARNLLSVARASIDKTSQLLSTQAPFPIKIWVYASANDMRPAQQQRSDTFEQQVVTAGQRVSSDTVLVLGGGAAETLRHELAHILTKQAGEGPFSRLPSWLDEGTAMYAQNSPGTGLEGALNLAIQRNSLLSLRSMSSPTGNPNAVNLFYGQAWSVVKYLVENHGQEKFAQLYAVFKAGTTVDEALGSVYGFDLNGLEDAWRASAGLSPRSADQPTTAPTQAPRQQTAPTPQTRTTGVSSQDEGASVVVVVAIAALAVAVLAVAATGGVMLVRRLR